MHACTTTREIQRDRYERKLCFRSSFEITRDVTKYSDLIIGPFRLNIICFIRKFRHKLIQKILSPDSTSTIVRCDHSLFVFFSPAFSEDDSVRGTHCLLYILSQPRSFCNEVRLAKKHHGTMTNEIAIASREIHKTRKPTRTVDSPRARRTLFVRRKVPSSK